MSWIKNWGKRWGKVLVIAMSTFLILGCSYTKSIEYYEVRDKAVVEVLLKCRSEDGRVFDNGFTVKDLVVSFVDTRHRLDTCVVVTEEVIGLLSVE